MLIFQYGSNCSETRLNSHDRLRGDAIDRGLAETVDSFQLQFDVWSDKNECAASDIVPGGESTAMGVLYEVPDNLITRDTAPPGRKSLDAIEGRAYERHPIKVRNSKGEVVDAVTYLVKDKARNIQTSLAYVGHIVSGLRAHKADEKYINRIKAIASENNPEIAAEVAKL